MERAGEPPSTSRGEPRDHLGTAEDDVLEIGRLVLELVHAGYAADDPGYGRAAHGGETPGGVGALRDGATTRDGTTGSADAAAAHASETPRVSRQALRASIELYQRGELTMTELAASLGMSPGWATRVVDELVAAGLAERASEPRDRRVVRIRLAPAARQLAADAYRWHGSAIEKALDGLDEGERRAIRTFLTRALVELGADAASGRPKRRGDPGATAQRDRGSRLA